MFYHLTTGAINNMMKPKTAEPQLWKLASELPYKESKFSTIIREFTPSFFKKDYPFIVTTIGASKKKRTHR